MTQCTVRLFMVESQLNKLQYVLCKNETCHPVQCMSTAEYLLPLPRRLNFHPYLLVRLLTGLHQTTGWILIKLCRRIINRARSPSLTHYPTIIACENPENETNPGILIYGDSWALTECNSSCTINFWFCSFYGIWWQLEIL